MANAMDAQVLSFRHADFLAVSATHATAQLALHDDYVWEKYQFAKATNGKFKTNTLGAPVAPAAVDITIPSLMRRGAVFLACHIALWERAGALIAAGTNPDGLSREALTAELTNHLIPGVVLTPGAVAPCRNPRIAGFRYIPLSEAQMIAFRYRSMAAGARCSAVVWCNIMVAPALAPRNRHCDAIPARRPTRAEDDV